MATPTVPVTVDLDTIAGEAIEGITVRARLDGNEIYEGIVVSRSVTAVTGAGGVAVLDLFPNALAPTGLGTQGTRYRFTAAISGGRSVNVQAVVPNEPCRLENILVSNRPVTLSAAELALAQAQTAVTTAATSAAAAAEDAIQTAADRIVTEEARAAVETFIADFGDLSTAISSTTASAATAATNAETATAQATIATAAKEDAEAAQAAAEAARDVAQTVGGIYADTTAGLAAVASGEYFYVPSPVPEESLILYRDNAGTAVEVKRYPSVESVEALQDLTPEGYAFALLDDAGRAAFGVTDDGTVDIDVAEVGSLTAAGTQVDRSNTENVFSVEDDDGNIAFAVSKTGEVRFSGDRDPDTRRSGGRFTHQVIYFNNAGQSLAYGPASPLTTAQSYDNMRTNSEAFVATQIVPAVALLNEPPMFGAMEMVKQLIEQENGVAYGDNDYVLVGDNQGSSGARLDEIHKGGSRGKYELAISNLTFTNDEYSARGVDLRKTVGAGATFFTQGESDQNLTAEATYTARLIQYATDFDTDARAVTGQLNRVPLICYQTHTHETVDGPRIGLALLEAHKQSPLIHMATPIYFMTFTDGLHLDQASTKWLGAYYGLVYKRVVIDGQEWEPLRPINHSVVGNTITLGFTKRGLTLDTTTVPAQTNYGFTLRTGAGAAVSISSVEIIGGDRVRITAASTPASGWKVQYGNNASTGIGGSYVGGAGNLRDKAGDALVYLDQDKPMHNWCVFFNYEI